MFSRSLSLKNVQLKFLSLLHAIAGQWQTLCTLFLFRPRIVANSAAMRVPKCCVVGEQPHRNLTPLNAELYSISHLRALLGAHLIFHVSRIRVKLLSTHCLELLFFYLTEVHSLGSWTGDKLYRTASCSEVPVLTLRLLMSYIYIYIYIYIYGAPILDVSRSHTMTQHSR